MKLDLKKIAAVAAAALVLSVPIYLGSSNTGLFYNADVGRHPNYDTPETGKSSEWVVMGRVSVIFGNISVLDT